MARNFFGGGLALALLAAACGGPTQPRVEGDIAFVNANVIPMDVERVLENRTVVIAGGRIAAIGSAEEIVPAAGVELIDAAGGYLLPGFAELHGHLPNPRTSDRDAQNILFLYVANGVTTVRGMQGDPSQFRPAGAGPQRRRPRTAAVSGQRGAQPRPRRVDPGGGRTAGPRIRGGGVRPDQDARRARRGDVRRGGAGRRRRRSAAGRSRAG